MAEIPGGRHKLVRTQSLNCAFLYSIWRKTAYFGRFCRLIKPKRNMEYDLFHLHPQFIYESFHILYIISLLSLENGNPQLTLLPMCGFIAQLVEYRTGNAEVTGSNPVEGWIFFRLLISNCINWKIHCDDHFSLSGNRHVASIKSTITWNINFES